MEHHPVVAIVDDDTLTHVILKRVLQLGGMDAVGFETPDAFLDYMRTHTPDCILLDMNMPGLNGIEVECRLKEMGSTVPVIMVTGDSDVPTATAALHHGAVDFVTKPIESAELLCRIREIVTPVPSI